MALRFFFASLFLSSAVSAADLTACSFNSAFSNIVYNVIGTQRAKEQTSFSAAVFNVQSGELLCAESVSGDKNIYPASTIKTIVAIAVLRKIETGEVRWADVIIINQPNADADCVDTDCKLYGSGKTRTVEQLMWDMITVSNNVATNQLIDIAGKSFINETAVLLNASGLKVFRKVYSHKEAEPDIKTPNEANADSFVQIYREISTGFYHLLSPESRTVLTEILKNQKINGSLNKNFPKEIPFYHKTGNTSQVTGDGGFYYLGPNTVVVLVGLQNFTKLNSSTSGFASLARVGLQTLNLTLSLK